MPCRINFLFSLCFLLLSFQLNSLNTIQQFVERLPIEQKNTLDYFSQKLLTSPFTSVGYILFGNKPMCIAAMGEYSIRAEWVKNNTNFLGVKGFNFLCDLNIPKHDKKYTFVEWKDGVIRHLIFINEDFKSYLGEYKKFIGFSCFRSEYEFWKGVKELKIWFVHQTIPK